MITRELTTRCDAPPATRNDRPNAYAEFRVRLLRHWEQRVLLPEARPARGGKPLPIASKLRLDHGAYRSAGPDADADHYVRYPGYP